ncbi:MAG: hypothetical protein ACRDE2_00275 [Chitinophagaceae bacterium]
MADFTPLIISPGDSKPDVGVTIEGYSYSAFLSSLSSIFYYIFFIEFYSENKTQLMQNFTFTKKSANGKKKQIPVSFKFDPYQIQNVIKKDLDENQIILNEKTSLQFTLLASTTLQIILSFIEFNPKDLLYSPEIEEKGYIFISDIVNYLDGFKKRIHASESN